MEQPSLDEYCRRARLAVVRIATLFANATLSEWLETSVQAAGFTMSYATNWLELYACINKGLVDAVLVDSREFSTVDMEYMTQADGVSRPLLFVIGRLEPTTIQAALSKGAADYFDIAEDPTLIVQRVAVYVQARAHRAARHLEVHNTELNLAESALCCGTHWVSLTPNELTIADLLFRYVGKTVPTEAFAMHVWGRTAELCRRSLEQHIYRLRKKFVAVELNIVTVYGIGYRLETLSSDSLHPPSDSMPAVPQTLIHR